MTYPMTYDVAFYDTIRPGVRQSAGIVVPLILEQLATPPARVVDVGCGEGWWALEFERLTGAYVTGLDGEYVASSPLGDRFRAVDLAQPFISQEPYDLAVCLEVAEHLPEERAQSFVADLCKLAPVVVFSAAIPGQPGAGHINCQWPTYWANLFAELGYGFDGTLREKIWPDKRIEPWYRQNLHLAVKGGPSHVVNRVHPVIARWLP